MVSKRREVRHTQVSLAIAGGEGGGVTVHSVLNGGEVTTALTVSV